MRFLCLVCTCSSDGLITKVILNNLPGLQVQPNTRFLRIFDRENLDKAQLFFLRCGSQAYPEEAELVINTNDQAMLLYFKGVDVNGERLILAESELDDLLGFYQDLMGLNNVLVNTIRELHKKSRSDTEVQLNQDYYLQEFAKVNNELISIQRELSKKNVELERLNELKNQFVGMAAHDLRNPLGVIHTYSGFILDEFKADLSPTLTEFLDIIRSTSIYMLKLVEDILDLSYIQSGKVKLDYSECSLLDTLVQIVLLNQSLASAKDIKISFHSNCHDLILHVDTVKIRQVLTNLITNAIKYSPACTEISVNVQKRNKDVLISVSDQGYGIPEEELDLIFEPFRRSNVQKPDDQHSSGLGLTISRNIIKAHKGSIWAESKAGAGSTFYFTLPLDE